MLLSAAADAAKHVHHHAMHHAAQHAGGSIAHHGPGVPLLPVLIIGPLMFLIIVGLVVALIVRGRRPGMGAGGAATWQAAPAGGALASVPAAPPAWTAAPGPEQVLADRFARGEVDQAEYRARRDALRGDQGA